MVITGIAHRAYQSQQVLLLKLLRVPLRQQKHVKLTTITGIAHPVYQSQPPLHPRLN